MVSITCIVWCLVFAYGVSCESPTPPGQWWVESSVSEEISPSDQEFEWKGNDPLEHLRYELPAKDVSEESEWTAYSPEIYPLFRKAVKELAASEHGVLVLWDTLNRPEHSRQLFEQVFAAYNRLASDDASSGTTKEAIMYHLATTEPEVSEAVTGGVYTEDGDSGVDDSNVEYHNSVSHDGDEAAVYYTTESPSIETMLTDGAFYTSSVASEDHGDASEEAEGVYAASVEDLYETPVEEVVDHEESIVDVAESEWENIVRRSGVVVENHPSTEATPDADCEGCPVQVGSIRGIPGVHFPNYDDIPITSFSCADKRVPGFYADLETGCQVFHVCWPHRRESFLCPIGTLFNQAILACDYWYSTNCSLSSLFFDVTTLSPKPTTPACEKSTIKPPKTTGTPILSSTTQGYTTASSTTESVVTEDYTEVSEQPHVDLDWFRVAKFIPTKSKVTVYSKHSSKKPGMKWVVKQKHDVLPLVEEFLELTKNIAKNAIRLVPKTKVDVVKPGIPKSKVVKVKPAAKLEPCLKIKDIKIKPTPPVVKKPQPLPKLDPRFIVKPVVGRPLVVHIKKDKFVFPVVPVKQVKPLGVKAFKPTKHHAPAIVMKALEVAGNVLQRDILDLTRQALVESHVDSLKSKHH